MATSEQAREWLERYNAEQEEILGNMPWYKKYIHRCEVCRLPLGTDQGAVANGYHVCDWTECIGRALERPTRC